MKVSRAWLQKYFETELPPAEKIAEALTLHVAEVEEVEQDSMEVKVLPDRAAYMLCHRGIAKELSAILDIPMKKDPLREAPPQFSTTDKLEVRIDESACLRHMAALVTGVKVGPSPAWMKEALEAVGQRSINNIVDITNYLTLDMGQPMHAFDARKISWSGDILKIDIRRSEENEKVRILSGEEYLLPAGTLVIADGTSGEALDIAGIKGGFASGITDETTDLFISVGNYDGPLIRRTAQALKLFTDASTRYQNKPSPELVAYGMQRAAKLFADLAGGALSGVIDLYPHPEKNPAVSVTARDIAKRVGMEYPEEEIRHVFTRLGFDFRVEADLFTVTAPFERRDISIPEDLTEEVARLIGYDALPEAVLSASSPGDQDRFRGIERMKDMLVEQGFMEVSTQSFAEAGDVYLANPLDKTRPALRTALTRGLTEALEKARQYAPLLLGPAETPKLFEVGSVFPKEGEYMELEMSEAVEAWGNVPTKDNLSAANLEEYGKDYTPRRYRLGPYHPFSVYPFAIRDIAFWCPASVADGEAETLIRNVAGPLLARLDLFDTFKKDMRVSYAFRLVLQALDRTLTEEEISGTMGKVEDALRRSGWEVR
ncbi:MAG: phenylalanine--tRNA ligase subunit beta [Patescibacteria group bacterium]|nr:phenylalanine--tRNA ligase subunit beta [Patescibacteria group bacterium]